MDLNVIIDFRQFCNKMWNTYRYIVGVLGDDFKYDPKSISANKLNLADRWILTQLNKTIASINKSFEGHYYADATNDFKVFWEKSFSASYLEYSKLGLKDESRAQIIKTIL